MYNLWGVWHVIVKKPEGAVSIYVLYTEQGGII